MELRQKFGSEILREHITELSLDKGNGHDRQLQEGNEITWRLMKGRPEKLSALSYFLDALTLRSTEFYR